MMLAVVTSGAGVGLSPVRTSGKRSWMLLFPMTGVQQICFHLFKPNRGCHTMLTSHAH
jgi:hypothetical protein